jgi:hypothetical protein
MTLTTLCCCTSVALSLFERYFGANALAEFLTSSSASETISSAKMLRLSRHMAYDWGIFSVEALRTQCENDRAFLSQKIDVRLDRYEMNHILAELKKKDAGRRNVPFYETILLAIGPLEFLVTLGVLVLGGLAFLSGERGRRIDEGPSSAPLPSRTQQSPRSPQYHHYNQQQYQQQQPPKQHEHTVVSVSAPSPPVTSSSTINSNSSSSSCSSSHHVENAEQYNFYKLMSQFDKKGSPAKKSKVVVLHSSTEWNTHTNKMVDLFAAKKFNVVMVDGTVPESKDIRDVLFLVSGLRGKYPQCFLSRSRGHFEFVGTWDAIGDLLENESLPDKFLREHPEIRTFSTTFTNIEMLE